MALVSVYPEHERGGPVTVTVFGYGDVGHVYSEVVPER